MNSKRPAAPSPQRPLNIVRARTEPTLGISQGPDEPSALPEPPPPPAPPAPPAPPPARPARASAIPAPMVPSRLPLRAPSPQSFVTRSRTYSFVLDELGHPIELGSGRFAKAFLGEERWVESETAFSRRVAIKVLQKGVSEDDKRRFQIEKQILERVQGHPNIVGLAASGAGDNPGFLPISLRDKLEDNFMILDLLDTSLEERLKGSRHKRGRDDLLALPPRERVFRVLEYVLPVASAVEYAHLVRDTCHRDIKPANVLIKLPDPRLRSSQMEVKLADFNVGKQHHPAADRSMTQFNSVPGTLYFQSPEQETNSFELLVNVQKGSPEVEFFEDFYIDIYATDVFSLFNRSETYTIASADRLRKRLILSSPFAEGSEANVRAKVTKAVGRPADIYSLGALLYYLISGAFGNPKALYDAFRKFLEYDRNDQDNTVTSYIEHEYRMIQSMRAPKPDSAGVDLAPEDRFFSYKHFLDGNGELIDAAVMNVIAKAMVRNKPDSYCQSWDLQTEGISGLVGDLMALYLHYGVDPAARLAYLTRPQGARPRGAVRRAWDRLRDWLRRG
jgi:serine/threonine protein kinase